MAVARVAAPSLASLDPAKAVIFRLDRLVLQKIGVLVQRNPRFHDVRARVVARFQKYTQASKLPDLLICHLVNLRKISATTTPHAAE
jgi:hypothetical protein